MQKLLSIILVIAMGSAGAGFVEAQDRDTGKTGPAEAMKNRNAPEEEAVRATAGAFEAAFNKGDAKALSALWTDDCEYVDENGRVYRGRPTIEKEYAAFFAANPGAQIETSISAVKIIGPSIAIEDGSTLIGNSRQRLLSRGYYTATHVKVNGKWLIASVRENAVPRSSERMNLSDLDWLIGDWSAANEPKAVDLTFRRIGEKGFVALSYNVREKDNVVRSGMQIIGRDPGSGAVVSWSFDSDGGYGKGQWSAFKNGWIVESTGMMADGTPTASSDIVSKMGADSFSWQFVNRRVAGKSLGDSQPATVKRKSR